jgi:hypothetical protein
MSARLLVGIVLALSIRAETRVIAWAPEGKSLLVERRLKGPEGGGALAYFALDVAEARVTPFVLSSDLSPGGGDPASWQKVSVPLCRERAQALAAALASRSFTGVSIHVAHCDGNERNRIVSLDAPAPAPAGTTATADERQVTVKPAKGKPVTFALP